VIKFNWPLKYPLAVNSNEGRLKVVFKFMSEQKDC